MMFGTLFARSVQIQNPKKKGKRMESRFSPLVSEILAISREEATRLSSSTVGPEHLLLGIIRKNNHAVEAIFSQFKLNTTAVKEVLEERLKGEKNVSESNSGLMLNPKASAILKQAVLEARLQHTETVDAEHLLMAILHDQANNGAKEVLEFNNMDYQGALACLQRLTAKDGFNLPDDEFEEEEGTQHNNQWRGNAGVAKTAAKKQTPALDNFAIDLTKAAADNKLDPVVGRDKEIARLIEILCRRKKNNPILIGEPGVGKSAIVEGLAQMIAKRKTSPVLFNKRVLSLDLAGLVAGTKYRGQFEERILTLIKEIEQNPDIIVFIDEIHTMVGAGSTQGSMDAANIMKPALARGAMQCIGATTLDEYRNSIEKDGALERRFQKIIVEQTTAEETKMILHNIAERYEKHHHVLYSEDAIAACVSLTERYATDRAFPDKAIDALDEAGAKVRLKNTQFPPEFAALEAELEQTKAKKQEAVKSQNFELAAGFRDKQTEIERQLSELQENLTNFEGTEPAAVTPSDVADVVSVMTGVPVTQIDEPETVRLRSMATVLKGNIIAQDSAIDKVVKSIQRNRVGLRESNRPIGVFMFLGPTGVGKTYLAKKLAEQVFGAKDALIRIDMSEFSESFNVSRLVGAPPGYVGYEEGGQLTERVRRKPYSIVLLDEIEKAHPNVFNMLLQVLDEGRLTDGNGRLVDFRNTIIIMTSNAGTRQLKEFGRGVGFNARGTDMIGFNDQEKENARAIIQKSLSKQFAPEFLNRLDDIITFDQLDLDAIRKITVLELKDLYARVENMGYKLEITDEAKDFVASKGYDVQYGARPLKRAIQNHVEDGVCELLLSDSLRIGDTIVVSRPEEAASLTFEVRHDD